MANADGTIIIKTDIDDKAAQTELNQLTKKIDALNEKINDKKQKQMPLVEQSAQLAASLDRAKATLAEMQSGNAFYTDAAVKEQEATVKRLQKEFDTVAGKVEKMGDAISSDTSKLERMREKAGGLATRLAEAKKSTKEMSDAAKAAAAQVDKFSKRVKTLAKRVLVFSLITRALRAFKDYVWESIQTNTEAMAAVAKLKGALLTLAQPLLNVLIPAFTVLVNVLTRVINVISQFASLLAGTTVDASAKAAKSLYEQKKAISGVGSAAKKASKQLASFDELTSISNGASSSTSSAVTPDFTSGINDQLSAVAGLFVGAALLGLGAILTFSGASIPLGLALMVMGGLSIWSAVSQNWNEIANALKGQLGKIVGYVSAALLAVGLILLLSGANIPLGLGLLAAGAVGLASVIAANWDSVKTPLINTLKELLLVAAGASLAIGLVLLLTGANIPLGLGLLIAGAAGLAGWIAANWDFITDKFKSIWSSIKSWWKSNVAPVFTAAWWKNLGKTIMNGLIAGVEAGINWVLRGIGDMVNGITGLLNKIPGINIAPVSWGNVKIPRLAQGAVIPPNREFLAVLGDQKHGTNVEAPLETIQQAVAQVFANMSPQLAQAIVSAFIATGMIGNIQAIEDYTRATAAKDFTLGTPNSATGRWVDQSLAAYARVKG